MRGMGGKTGRAVGCLMAFTISTGALGATPADVGAQDADTLVLGLDQALEIARGSNPTYRQAVNSTGLNGAETRTTWLSQVLPQAQLNLFSTGFDGNISRIGTDDFGNPILRPEADWVYASTTRQALTLNWSIQGASLFQALDRQRLTNTQRELSEAGALTGVEIAVRRAFMDVLEQRDLLEAERETLEGRRTDQDVSNRLFRLAMRTRVDVLNAELAVEQQTLAVQQQSAAFQRAKLTLRTALGDEALPPLRLVDEVLPIFDPGSLDPEALVATAERVNPEMRSVSVAVDEAELGVSEANRSWWPTLTASAQLSRVARSNAATGESSGAALFDVSFDEDLDQNFYVGLSFPMFNNYFQNRQEQHRARIDRSNRREALRETQLRTEETVRSALLELENQHESLRLAERSAVIAREALRLAREEYRLGTRDFEDLRDAFDQEAQTRRQVIQARHAFVDALLSLEEAVGTAVRPAGAPGA